MQRFARKWRFVFNVLSLPHVLLLGVAAQASDASAASGPYTFHDMNILGTSLDLQVAASSAGEAEKVHAAVLPEIERMRKVLSTYESGSDISRVNSSREAVKVGPELIEVLKIYEQMQGKSKGAYTAGVGELVAAWKKAEKDGRAPEASALAAMTAKLQRPLWKIDDAARTVQRLGDVILNVDSIGKGYIANHAAVMARNASGVKGMLLNIGGDIVALGGSSATGPFTPWIVGVTDPEQPADNAPPLVQLKLTATSVATSGNYARGYNVGGKEYSHLLDPRSGLPVDFRESKDATVDSATVIAPDNAVANALATTLCVLSPVEALALVKTVPEAHCLLIMSDGSQERSPGFKKFEVAPSSVTTAPAKPAEPDKSTVVTAGAFPSGFQLTMDLQINAVKGRERPIVAVWIENEQGGYVKTLALWGNERKYLKSLRNWWVQAQKDSKLVASATRATRAAGKYTLMWDGTDDNGKPVGKGAYKVCVDTAFHKGGQAQASGRIVCGDHKATGTVTKTTQFQDVTLTYGPKGS